VGCRPLPWGGKVVWAEFDMLAASLFSLLASAHEEPLGAWV